MAIAFVQRDDFFSAVGAGTVANDAALNTTTGNFLAVVVCGWDGTNGAALVTGITDTAGNTYLKVVGEWRTGSDNEERCEIWYAKNITGNANNITTATYTGTVDDRFISVAEFSGVHTTAPLDQLSFASEAGVTEHNAGGINTTVNDEVLIGGHMAAAREFWTEGAGWTSLTTDETEYFYAEYRIVSSSGAYDTAAVTDTIGDTINAIASFKIAAAPPVGAAGIMTTNTGFWGPTF